MSMKALFVTAAVLGWPLASHAQASCYPYTNPYCGPDIGAPLDPGLGAPLMAEPYVSAPPVNFGGRDHLFDHRGFEQHAFNDGFPHAGGFEHAGGFGGGGHR
jgi:hypothetical protein